MAGGIIPYKCSGIGAPSGRFINKHEEGACRRPHSYLLLGASDDLSKVVRLERRATYQTTVDIGLAKQVSCCSTSDRTTIEDLDLGSHIGAEGGQIGTDMGVNGLSNFRGGSLASTDGPYRLVSDDGIGERVDTGTVDDSLQLGLNHTVGCAGFELLQG